MSTPFHPAHPAGDPARLIVALDFPSGDEALALADQLQPLGVTFKVGMELYYREGMPLVRALQDRGGRLFVDLKLHDIPNTVARASEALVSQGVEFFNLHAQGGPEMMRLAAEAAEKAAREMGRPKPLLIAVTVLTSLSQEMLRRLNLQDSPEDYALHLAKLAQESGLGGVVCSAQEAARIREACGPDFVLVTPGIRPADASLDDQSRVMTPARAIAAGANYLVVGRPITRADDPVAAAKAILQEMGCLTPA